MHCAVCEDLDVGKWDSGSPTPRGETMTGDLERSAATGDCQFCVMLYRGTLRVSPPRDWFYIWRKEDTGMEKPLLWFTPNHQSSEISEFHSMPSTCRLPRAAHSASVDLTDCVQPEPDARCEAVPPSYPVSGDATAEGCLEFARFLISDCLENHTECTKPISTQRVGSNSWKVVRRLQRSVQELFHKRPRARLPTRLLDVGSAGSGSIRLLESTHIADHRAPYACLSHCWGNAQPLTTNMSTLAARRTGIAWGALPKTFQDAVDFTRRLGIRYLWIDSLCIVQDSKEDWRRESSTMASVYENCIVCLAATVSSDHQGGLYFPIPNPGVSTKVLDLIEKGESFEIYVRGALRHPNMTRQSPLVGFENGFPLLQRAWVFQEMLLAPRIVHFWEHELYFQCMTDHLCECGARLRDGFSKASHFEALCGTDPVARQQHWRDMVTQYSKLRLTYASDKFPALAGLAKQMMRFRRGRYLAGLWEDSLFDDLCWRMAPSRYSHPAPEPRDSRSYVAPSWSWASVKAPVEYGADITNRNRERKFVPDAKLIMVRVSNVDKHDPTGQVVSGFLRVSATWTRTNPDSESARRPKSDDQGSYYLLLGGDGSHSNWLVLKRQPEPEQYQRKGYLEVSLSDETKGLLKERRVFTIV